MSGATTVTSAIVFNVVASWWIPAESIPSSFEISIFNAISFSLNQHYKSNVFDGATQTKSCKFPVDHNFFTIVRFFCFMAPKMPFM